MKPPLLTVKEAAVRLNIAQITVWRFLRSGDLRGVRLGPGPKAPWRVDERDLEAYIEKHRQAPAPTVTAAVNAAFDADAEFVDDGIFS